MLLAITRRWISEVPSKIVSVSHHRRRNRTQCADLGLCVQRVHPIAADLPSCWDERWDGFPFERCASYWSGSSVRSLEPAPANRSQGLMGRRGAGLRPGGPSVAQEMGEDVCEEGADSAELVDADSGHVGGTGSKPSPCLVGVGVEHFAALGRRTMRRARQVPLRARGQCFRHDRVRPGAGMRRTCPTRACSACSPDVVASLAASSRRARRALRRELSLASQRHPRPAPRSSATSPTRRRTCE